MKKAILIICIVILIGLIWIIRDLYLIKKDLGIVTFKPSIEEKAAKEKQKQDSIAAVMKLFEDQAEADSIEAVNKMLNN